MRHKYLRHKCLRIWGEIVKLNVAECELSNRIAKINVAKSLKICMAKRKHLCRKIQCTYAETASKFK